MISYISVKKNYMLVPLTSTYKYKYIQNNPQ